MKDHRPPHIYLPDHYYFITARTYGEINHFKGDENKQILQQCLAKSLNKYVIKMYAYVILSNHYHLLFKLDEANHLSRFIQNLHQNSSRLLRRGLSTPARISERKFAPKVRLPIRRGLSSAIPGPVWYQYWDKCVNSEKDFFMHFNYIHQNPIKHGYVKNIDELAWYEFSSYPSWLKTHGEEFLLNLFRDYPILDYSAE